MASVAGDLLSALGLYVIIMSWLVWMINIK